MVRQREQEDGRRVRGRQRQELLLATALDLVRRRGLPELTTRALADAAGVSLASITYHFATRAELVQATCVEAMRQDLTMLNQAVDDLRADTDLQAITPGELAGWCMDLVCDPQGWARPMFSFYLEAVRQPELAAVAEQWQDASLEVAGGMLAEAGAPHPTSAAVLLTATLAGLRLPLLARADTDSVRAHRDDLARLLEWILGR